VGKAPVRLEQGAIDPRSSGPARSSVPPDWRSSAFARRSVPPGAFLPSGGAVLRPGGAFLPTGWGVLPSEGAPLPTAEEAVAALPSTPDARRRVDEPSAWLVFSNPQL
jgi:hypothetical protein